MTPGTVAHQAPLSMGFSRQEYWSGLPFRPPGDLPDPGIQPASPALQADSLPSEPPGTKAFTLHSFVPLFPESTSHLFLREAAWVEKRTLTFELGQLSLLAFSLLFGDGDNNHLHIDAAVRTGWKM